MIRIEGVGEIESPVTTDKTKAFAQAGIYGVGQLASSSHNKYRFVGRADSMSLKEPDELQLFAWILVSTIKWVLS